MAFSDTNHLGTSEAGNFIPKLWSDEVIATYKKNLVVANLVTKINHKGKKGNTIYIPKPARKDASAKATDSTVTLTAQTNNVLTVTIDKHYEYSTLIEDIASVQALGSMRKFITDDAGNASAFSAAGGDKALRAMVEKLDLQDVPMDNRCLVITPRQYSDLLGINRFTEQQFIGSGDAIRTGKVGMIYGVEVFVTNNLPTTQCATSSVVHDIGLMLHKEALVLAEQVGIRTQTQYKQEYLSDLLTADTLYGVAEYRDEAGFAFITDR